MFLTVIITIHCFLFYNKKLNLITKHLNIEIYKILYTEIIKKIFFYNFYFTQRKKEKMEMIKLTDDIALCNELHKKYHGKYCKIATLSNFMLFIKKHDTNLEGE